MLEFLTERCVVGKCVMWASVYGSGGKVKVVMFGVFLGQSVNVSLNATGALICIHNGNVIVHRPSIMTISIGGSRIVTMNHRTGSVVNHAPNSVSTIHPLGSNIVTSFRIASTVLHCFVGQTLGGAFFDHPHLVIYVPSNIARIRHHSIGRTTHGTNTHRIRLVRRPVTTTVNTNLSITRTTNYVIISVNNNASRITIVSLNSVIATRSIHITNSSFSRTVVSCVGGGCGLLVNRHATRSLGVALNSTFPCRGRASVSIGNHGLISNLPGGVIIDTRRIQRTLTSPINSVISTVGSALRQAPPRLDTSVVSGNVVLANNNTLLHNLSVLVGQRANVPMRITRSPLSYIIGNANGYLRLNTIDGFHSGHQWKFADKKQRHLPLIFLCR